MPDRRGQQERVVLDPSTGTRVGRLIEIFNVHGHVSFRAMLVDRRLGEASLAQCVAAFHAMADDVAGGYFRRGRERDDVINYPVIEVQKANRDDINRAFLGPTLIDAGCRAGRVLVFPGFADMTWHWDSGHSGWLPAKLFVKFGGSFSRGGDEYMLPLSISHDGLWLYSMCSAAFLHEAEGGYGAAHHAGSFTNEPSFSLKVLLPGNDIATTELLAAAMQYVVAEWPWDKYLKEGRPLPSQDEIKQLEVCGRARGGVAGGVASMARDDYFEDGISIAAYCMGVASMARDGYFEDGTSIAAYGMGVASQARDGYFEDGTSIAAAARMAHDGYFEDGTSIAAYGMGVASQARDGYFEDGISIAAYCTGVASMARDGYFEDGTSIAAYGIIGVASMARDGYFEDGTSIAAHRMGVARGVARAARKDGTSIAARMERDISLARMVRDGFL